MPQYLVHKNGAFNIYCTISDGAWFEHAVDQSTLEDWYRQRYGSNGMAELPARVERAILTGTSALTGETLNSLISQNRAGLNERRLGKAEFIRRYLTLPAS